MGEWGTRLPVVKSGGRRPTASPPHYTPDQATRADLTLILTQVSAIVVFGGGQVSGEKCPVTFLAMPVWSTVLSRLSHVQTLLSDSPRCTSCRQMKRPHFLLPGGQRSGLRRRRARVQIAAATLSGNSLRQTVHAHCASVHQAAKLAAALLRLAGVTAGLAESNGSPPPGL